MVCICTYGTCACHNEYKQGYKTFLLCKKLNIVY